MVLNAESSSIDTLLGVCLAVEILTGLCILSRLYGRLVIHRNGQSDDWLISSAWVFSLVHLILMKRSADQGLGTLASLEDAANTAKLDVFNRLGLSAQVIYTWALMIIKTSILASYLRIAITKLLRQLCYETAAVMAIFAFAYSVALILECLPVGAEENTPLELFGRCNSPHALQYLISGVSILLDIWIAALPVRTMSRAQRPPREMVVIYFIVLLPLLECIAIGLRIHAVRHYSRSEEPILDVFSIHFWAQMELGLGMVCACIPTFRPFTAIPGAEPAADVENVTEREQMMLVNEPASSIFDIPPKTAATTEIETGSNFDLPIQSNQAPTIDHPLRSNPPKSMDRLRPSSYASDNAQTKRASQTTSIDRLTLRSKSEHDWFDNGLELVVLPNGRVAPVGMVE